MSSWEARVASFWESVDAERPEAALAAMRQLLDERPDDDPDALYEWASVHDYLGMEAAAVPLYRASLDHGLAGQRRPQAILQLASSLRNIGRAREAVDLLQGQMSAGITGDAAQAFLALALHDLGRPDEALRVALVALAHTLPQYGNAIERYAMDLAAPTDGDR